MPINHVLVQTRINRTVKDRASFVLEGLGLTVSDVVRTLLTRIAKEGSVPVELMANSEEYDALFRARVLEIMNDPGDVRIRDDVLAILAAQYTESKGNQTPT